MAEDLHTGQDLTADVVLEGLIARGGFGTVHRGRERSTGRPVAVKLLHPGRGEVALRRFYREAAAAAALDHPGIVRVHAAGLHEGRPCIVYALVEGRTLREVLPGLPLERRLELVLQVARAMAHAHARGVIHRDLKPENVLVDAEGRAQVADFGLALVAGEAERLTGTGGMLGTPAYVAPEQFGGQGPDGPTADVWSLGVILYEALSGQLPHEGQRLISLLAGAPCEPPPAPRTLTPGVPRAVEAVCLEALQRDPARRPADAEQLVSRLEAALSPRPAGRVVGPALLGLGLLVLVGGVAWALTRTGAEPPAIAELPAHQPPAPAGTGSSLVRSPRPVERWLGLQVERYALALDEQHVLAWGRGGVEVWDALDGTQVASWAGGALEAARLERGRAMVAGIDHSLGLVEVRSPELTWLPHALPGGADALVARPQGAFVAINGRTLRVDPHTGALLETLPEGGPCLAISSDGALLAIGIKMDGTPLGSPLVVHDLARGTSRRLELWGRARRMVFSPRGDVLYLGLDTGQLQIVSMVAEAESESPRFFQPPQEELGPPLIGQAHAGSVVGLAVAPDGRWLYSLGSPEPGQGRPAELRRWDTRTGEQAGATRELRGQPNSLDVTPDGRLLVLGTDRGVLVLPVEPGSAR